MECAECGRLLADLETVERLYAKALEMFVAHVLSSTPQELTRARHKAERAEALFDSVLQELREHQRTHKSIGHAAGQ